MLRTFNCGIGAVLICSEEDRIKILNKLKNENAVVIGSVNTYGGKKLFVISITKTRQLLIYQLSITNL